MARPAAIRVALDLAFTPLLAPLAAKQPLPPGMITVLKIVGGCTATLDETAAMTGEPTEKIRGAAILFLETVLFTPAADSYRILGAQRTANQAELRDHMRWLMKWLHPDRERSEWESSLALRVSAAWDDLKSPERRTAYDAAHPVAVASRPTGSKRRQRRTRIPWISAPRRQTGRRLSVRNVALFIGLAGLACVLAMLWDGPATLLDGVFADGIAGLRR